jgi:hypothetical protein
MLVDNTNDAKFQCGTAIPCGAANNVGVIAMSLRECAITKNRLPDGESRHG